MSHPAIPYFNKDLFLSGFMAYQEELVLPTTALSEKEAILRQDRELAAKIAASFQATSTSTHIYQRAMDDAIWQFDVIDGEPALSLDDLISWTHTNYQGRRDDYPVLEQLASPFESTIHDVLETYISTLTLEDLANNYSTIVLADLVKKARLAGLNPYGQAVFNTALAGYQNGLNVLSSEEIERILTVGERHGVINDQHREYLATWDVYNFADRIQKKGLTDRNEPEQISYHQAFRFIGSDSYNTASLVSDATTFNKDKPAQSDLVETIANQIENIDVKSIYDMRDKKARHETLLKFTQLAHFKDDPILMSEDHPVHVAFSSYARTLRTLAQDANYQDDARDTMYNLMHSAPQQSRNRHLAAEHLVEMMKAQPSDKKANDMYESVMEHCGPTTAAYKQARAAHRLGHLGHLFDYLDANFDMLKDHPKQFFNNIGTRIIKKLDL